VRRSHVHSMHISTCVHVCVCRCRCRCACVCVCVCVCVIRANACGHIPLPWYHGRDSGLLRELRGRNTAGLNLNHIYRHVAGGGGAGTSVGVAAAAVTSPGASTFAIPRELAAAPARCRAIITSAKIFRHGGTTQRYRLMSPVIAAATTVERGEIGWKSRARLMRHKEK